MAPWTPEQIPDLSDKTALVTGANSGIGLETVRALATHGATVVLGCRSEARARAAIADVAGSVPDARLEFLALDLSDLDSVRAAARAFSARHRRLDLLCNNAGVMGHHAVQLTRQGFEMQFGTNHLGHFALTGLLFGALAAAAAPRVVAVSSVAHRATRGLNLDDPRFERTRYWHFDAYGKSKLANLAFALELNRRARKAGLTLKALAAHPGYSATNITSGTNQARSKVKDFVVGLGNSMMGMAPERGAMPTLYAATAPSIEGGEFIGPDGLFELWGGPSPRRPSRLAQDPALAGRLWQKSQEWTGVRFLDG